MKKLLLSAAVVLFANFAIGQQLTLDTIKFDPPAPLPTNGGSNNWFVNSTFPGGAPSNTSAPNCYRDTVPPGINNSGYFTTNSYDCSSFGYVAFSFNHICKIPPVERATIEVSINGGSSWTPLTGTHYKTNFYRPGTSPFFGGSGYFSSIAYPSKWLPSQPNTIPDASWWKPENFDISAIAAFQPDVRIRFKLTNFTGNGSNTREYGWLVDDIDLEVAPSVPPTITLINTNAGSISLGPFNFTFQIPNTGTGCCNTVYMYYSVNNGPCSTAVMTNTAADLWQCTIGPFNDLDTIRYFVQALDWNNVEGYYPAGFLPYATPCDAFNTPGGTKLFVASSGIHFPYFENFDGGNGGWYVDSALNQGSWWQWGQPNVGVTSGAYSFPDCWDVDLHSKYVNNTHTYLYTPLFTLTMATSNIKLTFWRNHYVQTARDGFRMEYSFNSGPWTRLGDTGDVKGTNWYDTTIAGSGTPIQPGWTGNTGGVWKKSEYFLQQFIGIPGNLQFRYVFDSDNFGNLDGVSIDDFSMVVPPPHDAQMVAVIKPGTSAPSGNLDSVKVRVRNVGSQTILNLPVQYQVYDNNNVPLTGIFTETLALADSIPPAAFKTYTFNTTYTIPPGPYHVCAWTNLTGDADRTNDTLCKSSVGVPLKPLPFKDNFDGPVVWYDSTDVLSQTRWELGTPNYGVTNSALSAPNAWDVNLNLPYYPSASTVLISPLFNFTGKNDVTMRFWQNRNVNEGEDGMRVEYSTTAGGADGSDWHILDTDTVPQDSLFFDELNWYTDSPIVASGREAWSGNSFGWKESKIVMRGLDNAGASVQFRFIFSSYSVINAPLDGVSIDNFSLKAISPNDAGIVEVLHPTIKGVAGDQDSVVCIIKNYGLNNLTTCPIIYRVNGGPAIGPFNWTGNLKTYQTDTVYLTTKYTTPAGYYDLCVFTNLPGDGDIDNDTSCNRPFGIPRKTITYSSNFDSPPQDWLGVAIDNVTVWQLGTPNYGVTNTTHSGNTAWDVNLNTEYKKNAQTELYSPIFNFTNQYNARLSFWQNFSVQARRDGVILQYKKHLTDTTWTLLDTLGNLYVSNWYNDSSNFAPLKPHNWTGQSASIIGSSSTGWIQSKMMLKELENAGPDVQFRFVFLSDANVNGSGYTIDDFSITKAPDADIAGLQILNPRQVGVAGDSDPLQVLVYNAGNLPITSLSLNYSINGTLQTPVPWSGNILPGDSAYITVANITVPHLAYTLCFWPVVANDGDHSNDTVCVDRFGAAKFNITYMDSMNTVPQEFFKLTTDNEWEFGFPISAAIFNACSPPYCWKTKINGNHSQNRNDFLYSPFFNMSDAFKAEMRMCINYKTEPTADGVRVDYSLDTGQTWTTLGTSGDPLGTNWYTTNNLSTTGKPAWEGNSQGWIEAKYKLDILQYSPGLVQFRFHFTSNQGGNNEGFALDNFEIYNPYRYDLAPVWIDPLPNPFSMSGPQTVKVYIQNRGSIDVNKYTATLLSDGVPVSTDVVTLATPLAYTNITSHVFNNTWTPNSPTAGGHDLCVITSLPNDSADLWPADDTLCTIVGVFDSLAVNNTNPQYCNDFDGTMTKWIPLNSYTQTTHGSNWMHGMPDKSVINTTYSGSTSWVTKLHDTYDPIDSSALYSPVFAVDSDGCYEVSFYHNFQMEPFQDGGVVEYSLDAGSTWHTLGYGFEQNWYNSVFITSLSRDTAIPGVAGWTGSSFGGWAYAAHNVKFYNPAHAVFRFRFGSDPSVQMDGWAIDNFCLKKIGPCTIGIEELPTDQLAMSQNYPNPASDRTSITYFLPKPGQVRLYLTNLLGQEVQTLVDQNEVPGQHMLNADVSMLSNGVYYYTLEFDGKKLVNKMVIAK